MADKRKRLRALSQSGLRLAALAAILAGSRVPSAAAQETLAGKPNIFHRPQTGGQAAALVGPSNLVFHGGPVMTSFAAYLIFWLPPGVHFSSPVSDANYEQLMMRYFQDVGGSPFYDIVTQYPGSNGTPANAVTRGGSVVDTSPYPHAGTTADPLLSADFRQEITNVIGAQGWPIGVGTMYFVFTGSGIQSCFDSTHTDCSQVQYCAFHSAFFLTAFDIDHAVVWANMPDAYSLGDCGPSNVNGDPAADTEINEMSHEHFEAVTDPLLNAWYDTDLSGEIGDKCAYNVGPGGYTSTTPNVFLNGHPYRPQREWSNIAGGCAASLCGDSVCQPAVTVSTTATTCVADTGGDVITYTLNYHNPSDVDTATNVSLTDTLPPGVQWTGGTTPTSIVGNVLTFNLPDIRVHAGGTIHISATLASPPAPFTLLENTATLTFSDSLGNPAPAVVSTAGTAVPCGAWCGNGVVDSGEQCDAGLDNGAAGSCCTSSCTAIAAGTSCASDANVCTDDVCDASGICTHPNNTAPCDDGNACTTGETCSGGSCQGGSPVSCGFCEICDRTDGCVVGPRPSCKMPTQSAKSQLQLKSNAVPAKTQLQWKWSKGAMTDITDLGNPLSSENYALCIFDESGVNPQKIFSAQVPAGGTCGTRPCWKQTGHTTVTGFQFGDSSGANAGVTSLKLKAGAPGKAQMSLKAKGTHLTLPGMPLPVPLRVQLQAESGVCWEAKFSTAVTKNDAAQFKAKSD